MSQDNYPGYTNVPEQFRAHSFRLTMCEDRNCRAIHIFLLDKHDKGFAAMTVSVDQVDDIVDNLYKAEQFVRAKNAGL